MVRYRIDVGREHGVEVRDIVGAIANEAGIESRFIGRIRLYDDGCTVELPSGMPKEVANLLKRLRIRGTPANLRPDGPGAGAGGFGGDRFGSDRAGFGAERGPRGAQGTAGKPQRAARPYGHPASAPSFPSDHANPGFNPYGQQPRGPRPQGRPGGGGNRPQHAGPRPGGRPAGGRGPGGRPGGGGQRGPRSGGHG